MSYGAPPPPSSYGQGGYGQAPSTSGMSIAALVLGIIAVPACGCFVFSVAAIVLGILGRKDVAQSNGAKKGGGMATAGLVLGIVTLVLAVTINALVLSGVIDVDYYGGFE